MRKTFMYFMAAMLAIGCGRGSSQPTQENADGNATPSATASKADTPVVDESERKTDAYTVQRVESIYADVFAEYNAANEEENEAIPQSSPDEKYCSDSWNKLLLQVSEFDQQHNPDDIGFFDADYWVMGQDFQDLSISNVKLTNHDGDEAEVEFDLHNSGQVTHVRLELDYERPNSPLTIPCSGRLIVRDAYHNRSLTMNRRSLSLLILKCNMPSVKAPN